MNIDDEFKSAGFIKVYENLNWCSYYNEKEQWYMVFGNDGHRIFIYPERKNKYAILSKNCMKLASEKMKELNW